MKLEFAVDQVNQLLNILAKEPYATVYQLIGTIQAQAARQAAPPVPPAPPALSEDEI